MEIKAGAREPTQMVRKPESQEQLRQALLLLNSGLLPFIEREMFRVYGDRWEAIVQAGNRQREQLSSNWDTQGLLACMWNHWNDVFKDKLRQPERSIVSELRGTRNKWAHQEPFNPDDTYRALDSIERLLRAVSAPEAHEIEALKQDIRRTWPTPQIPDPIKKIPNTSPSSSSTDAPIAKPHIPDPVEKIPITPPSSSPPIAPTRPSSAESGPRYKIKERFRQAKNLPPLTPEILNAQQQEAVEHTGSHLLVLAGAGTGKTTTLIYRTASLLKTIPANNIVVMSFTIKAAQELYERLYRLMPTAEMSMPWIGTFHSVCRRILADHAGLVGFKSRFGVLDVEDSRAVFRRCVPQGQHLDVGKLYGMYSFSRNSLKPWQDLLDRFGLAARQQGAIAKTLQKYHDRMRRTNKMDFDDLLTNTIALLDNHPQVRERYQCTFKQILVDEYQDTSAAQNRILELLANQANITVVGDDSQAIYSFRGATIENILQFDSVFLGSTTVRLEQNYRCTPEILDVANQSIANNKKRMPKILFTLAPPARKPVVAAAEDGAAEATFIADEVLALYKAGSKLCEMGVLFRSAPCVRAIEAALRKRAIPYVLFGATPFFSQPHIKDLLAWLSLVADPQDAFSLSRVWGQQRGLTDSLLGRVETHADRDDQPLLQAAFDFMPMGEPEARTALEDLQRKLSACRDEYEKTKNLALLLDSTLKLHFSDHIRRKFIDADIRLQDINFMRDVLARYSSLQTFLEMVGTEKLDVSQLTVTAGYEDGDILSVSTIHAAKGLEWKTVFVVGLVEGWFPHSMCVEEAALEEERRIFHVAVTRAKEILYLTYPQNVSDQRGDRNSKVSRFVAEVPQSLFEHPETLHRNASI